MARFVLVTRWPTGDVGPIAARSVGEGAMDLTKQSLFKMMNKRLDYLGERQKVLAQNVANADTPNFQARDLRPVNFSQAIRETERKQTLAVTQPGHLGPVSRPSTFAVDKQKKPYETTMDKNGVVLEEQMMKIAQTQSDHQMVAELYGKYVSMMKQALGRG